MTTMTTSRPTFAVGDRVTVDSPRFPGVWTVAQKLQVNYRLTNEGGQSLRCAPELMAPAPAEGEAAPLGRPYVPPVFFEAGQLVTLRGKAGAFVVLKSTPRGYSVAKLGGDAGRYWNASTTNLQALDAERVAAVLAAAND